MVNPTVKKSTVLFLELLEQILSYFGKSYLLNKKQGTKKFLLHFQKLWKAVFGKKKKKNIKEKTNWGARGNEEENWAILANWVCTNVR